MLTFDFMCVEGLLLILKHALALTALRGFFHTATLLYDLLFANRSKK
ncbi:hypothetical protein GARC_1465 [Paraglaciecola arctica BSs20135]|uniref:Uncharacterized protein n=1 Tax=Paraglaciecola arctica BSs20135 TaxID=493475 RepID=K6Z4U8_9ALTE|nr:hypothetical protein GARC_1465 [Paraglaciecola arctica BSs20135]